MSKPWEKYQKANEADNQEQGPWSRYKKPSEPEQKTSVGQTVLESYADVPLLGYLPNVQAGIAEASEKLSDWSNEKLDKIGLADEDWKTDQKLKELGIKVEGPKDDYIAKRDANLKRRELQKKENPNAHLIGTGIGIGASAVLGGKMLPAQKLKDLTRLQRIVKAAKAGAGAGAIYNPGDKEGEISGLQLGDRAKNAALGAAIGAGAQGGLEVVGSGGKKLAKWGSKKLKDLAEEKAAKAAGAIQKDFNKYGEDNLKRVGRQLLDKKIVKPFSTPKAINEAVEEATGATEQKLVGIIDDVTEKSAKTKKGFIKTKSVVDRLKKDVEKKFEGIPKDKIEAITDEIESWYGDMPEVINVKDMQKFKTSMQKFINQSNYYKDLAPGKQYALTKVRSGARQSIEDAAEELSGELGQKGGKLVKETNRELGDLYLADKLSEQGIARGAGNRAISLSDYVAGAGGAASGNPMVSAAITAANKGVRTFGNSLGATSADKVSKVLQKLNPDVASGAMNYVRSSQPGVQSTLNQSGKFLDKIAQNPDSIESIKNEKLKARLKKYVPGKQDVSEVDARDIYKQGN